MGKLWIVLTICVVLVAFLGERIVKLRRRTLSSREVGQRHLPNCRLIKGLDYGSEDISILPDGLAFISTGLKYPGMVWFSEDPGKLYTIDLEDSRMKAVELRMDRNFDLETFNPHGISIYVDEKDSSVYLYVVNHPNHGSQVEVFLYVEQESSLVYVKTIKHELLYSVNDLVVVGRESFYATNDHYFVNSVMRKIEFLFMQPWGNVIYYSQEEVKLVAEGFYMANGINKSPDGRHIYVADPLENALHVLEVKEDKVLNFVKMVALGSLCDNIDVHVETGDLWLGCHPNPWKLLLYNPEDPPGSEVIQVEDVLSEKPVVKRVFTDDGTLIQASSVAAVYRKKLLIGSVNHKAVVCDLP